MKIKPLEWVKLAYPDHRINSSETFYANIRSKKNNSVLIQFAIDTRPDEELNYCAEAYALYSCEYKYKAFSNLNAAKKFCYRFLELRRKRYELL
jgi:hypothetical protein